jgi:hypothetical protein
MCRAHVNLATRHILSLAKKDMFACHTCYATFTFVSRNTEGSYLRDYKRCALRYLCFSFENTTQSHSPYHKTAGIRPPCVPHACGGSFLYIFVRGPLSLQSFSPWIVRRSFAISVAVKFECSPLAMTASPCLPARM